MLSSLNADVNHLYQADRSVRSGVRTCAQHERETFATRNTTPLLASHDKHESRKSRDGERFRSAAEASFQLGGVSRSVSEPAPPFQRTPRCLTA